MLGTLGIAVGILGIAVGRLGILGIAVGRLGITGAGADLATGAGISWCSGSGD